MSNLLDKQQLYERGIEIVEYSATPNRTVYDLMSWNGNNNQSSKNIIGNEGDGYMSSQKLHALGRIRQYKDLCGNYDDDDENNNEEVLNNIRELKDCFEINFNSRDPEYHIIRTN